MQYGVSSFKEDGCQNCKFYTHSNSHCHFRQPENNRVGVYVSQGLSPCKEWKLGYIFKPNSWGMFEKIKEKKPAPES
jgi:hypothetical protein